MTVTAPLLWFDGALVPIGTVSLPLMGHATQRGSLVFDVGSFHRGHGGIALFRAREHVARLVRSAQIVGLALPFDEAALIRAAIDVVAACERDEGLVRWSVYLAAGEPDLVPRNMATHVAVAAQLLQDVPGRSLRIATYEDARKAAPQALNPEAKVAAAYLGPMLARRRAMADGADDVVLLDHEGNIAEAPIANAFAVSKGVLSTPPLGHILPGITRDSILTIARDEKLTVREAPLTRAAFAEADEAFLTATSLPLAPIASIDGRSLGETPGPLTARLAALFGAAQRGENPGHAAWLTSVG